MRTTRRSVTALGAMAIVALSGNVAAAQSLGTLDGYDDQRAAGQRAPLVGLATPNLTGRSAWVSTS